MARRCASTAAAVLLLNLASCAPPPTERAASTPPTAVAFSNSQACVAFPNYTVLQVGTTAATQPKKVADNCWWQVKVRDIRSRVDEHLGWQLCNSCNVDVEFQLSDVPSEALTGCNVFFDASGSATQSVEAGDTWIVDCVGLQSTKDDFTAGARLDGATTPFVDSDPELEIEDAQLAGWVSRLAQAPTLTLCKSNPNGTTSIRLTASGQFTPSNAATSVTLVQTGPGLRSTTWGADLIEVGPPQASPPPGAKAFSVSIDVPAHVTEFVLRPYGARTSPWRLDDIAPCR